MSTRILLQLEHVTKSFGGVSAVKDISFALQENQILGLIGPNGAGKTTVFNLISGNFRPDSGSIMFEGSGISGRKPHRITAAGISRTFQAVKPFPKMSVNENVSVGALFGRNHTLSVKQAREEAAEMLSYVGLETKADLLASMLSLAEQRKLELARALATKPRLLLLDEVMAGLNLTEIGATLELLRKIRSEKRVTLLIIEHIMKAMVRVCDSIIVMDHGEKIAEGLPSEVMANDAVITAYMGEKTSRRSTSDLEKK